MQGTMTNLFTCSNKIEAFVKRIDIWKDRINKANFDMFPCYDQMIEDKILKDHEFSDMSIIIQNHLLKLKERFLSYFAPAEDIRLGNMWIQNPFLAHENNVLSSLDEEQLTQLSCDKLLQTQFTAQKNLAQFWLQIRKEYETLSDKSIQLLLPFATTYLAESVFYTVTAIKNKYRNRLESIEAIMRTALTKSIEPRIYKLVNDTQEQKSH